MSIKISQLPAVSNIENSAIFPLVQNSETQIANVAQLSSCVAGNILNLVNITATSPGNLTVAHGLGTTPLAVSVQMTSGGQIWLQNPTGYDSTNLYLVSSGGNVSAPITGKAIVFV